MNKTGIREPITPAHITEHPVCACHGLPMLWQKNMALLAGGHWQCKERRREYNQRRYQQRLESNKRRRQETLTAYISQRRKYLAVRKAAVLDQLGRLSEEAKLVAQQGSEESQEAESDPPRRVHTQAAIGKDRLGGRRASPRGS